jgi:CubicO group peptidase (beta-lactamase class C family)
MDGGVNRPFERARGVIANAIGSRVFPGASVEVGSSAGPIWSDAFGSLTFGRNDPVTPNTLFDLASLTKVIATTTLAMEMTRTGAIDLDERLAGVFPEWLGTDRAEATVRDLLEHAAGLPARLLDAPPLVRREFEHDICTIRLEYPVRARSVYSDLGFILLAFLISDRGRAPLDRLFSPLIEGLAPGVAESLRFGPVPFAAPTEPMPDDLRRGRMLMGEVHDNYAAALGGVAGHAGLFGTAEAVGVFAQATLRAARGDQTLPAPFAPDVVARFTTRSAVAGSSRALGWDTMLPTSSCGTHMSSAAFGHVGFTGTSLWIDPERDRYFVLLTNRACGGGTLDRMRDVRRDFHDELSS